MKTYTQEELKVIIEKHGLWLNDDPKGEKANLRCANLRSADFRSANLRFVDFRSANLRDASFHSADLSSADLSRANLRFVDFRSANLRFANLRDASLRDASLRDASLHSARGDNLHIKTIHCGTYDIAYTSEILQIGCQNHKIKQWWEFSDQEINKMDEKKALDWWRLWKPTIKRIIKISPAQDTGYKNENN